MEKEKSENVHDSCATDFLKQCERYFEADTFFTNWEAFLAKYRNVKMTGERWRLLAKLAARLFGIRKCMYLGGYRRTEDIRQEIQDLKIYLELSQNESENVRLPEPPAKYELNGYKLPDIVTELGNRSDPAGKYIALMTETLDNGGLEKVVQLLALEYDKLHLPVKVLCAEYGGRTAEELKCQGIEVIVFNGSRKVFEKYIKEHRPLIVNTHYVSSFLEIIHLYNIPVVEVIHNMYVFLTPQGIRKELKKAEYITGYIAVSQTAKQIYRKKICEIPEDRIRVIGNAADRSLTTDRKCADIREELHIPGNAFLCLVAGSIDARKNQLGILRAWDIFRHITSEESYLIFAGESTDYEYAKKVLQAIKERELEQQVFMLGHRRDLYGLMDASDVFIIDSYYEGWSMAATEALYCGLPLIHSECGSGIELTAGGFNGILIDNPIRNIEHYSYVELYDLMHAGINENIMQLADAMIKMYRHKNEWRKRRKAIMDYAENHFSVRKMIYEYLENYLEACSAEGKWHE